jgi:hypothetical protein
VTSVCNAIATPPTQAAPTHQVSAPMKNIGRSTRLAACMHGATREPIQPR